MTTTEQTPEYAGMRLSMRPATADDVDRIVEIVNGEAGDEAIALLGSVDLACAYRKKLVELQGIPNPDRVTGVAQTDSRVVGVIQYRLSDRGGHGRLAHLRILSSLVGPLGVMRRAPKLLARMRVQIPIPEDSFYITLVHVETSRQGEHIGSFLLEWVEREALRLGEHRMTLTTTLNNEHALKLYARNGYETVVTATHPDYERRLNIPGRVLMEKVLAG
jgi:ribosomal protein S18 acetylase RimI-like enzyme